MNRRMLLYVFTCFVIGYEPKLQAQPDQLSLDLRDTRQPIRNRLELSISKKLHKSIRKNNETETAWKDSEAVVNGIKVKISSAHTRGQSSHDFRRKSFAITFDEPVEINSTDGSKKFKHIYALNLVLDKYYFNNRLAFALMKKVGLSGLFFSYSEIRINGHSEGIYLLIERPQDWALKTKESPIIIRRGYDHRADKLKARGSLDSAMQEEYLDKFRIIYELIERDEGAKLYSNLSKLMDLEEYMRWLSLNYLLQNGDYTDELYLYIDADENRFRLIPWDYDDIFAPEPHEGQQLRDEQLQGKLLFSSEDPLDVKIANDSYLYDRYLEQMNQLLEQLTPAVLKNELETIYAELFPYYADPDIISMNKYDWFNDASIETLKKELNTSITKLVVLRNKMIKHAK